MNCRISYLSSRIGFLVVLGCLLSCTQVIADSSSPLTLIYSGEERGLLGLHGCGAEQVGGLARRHTIIESLREEHPHALNLHTGNILDSANPNNELIYQIALEALSGMDYDAVCIGPQDLSLPTDTLSALYGNHPDLPVICTKWNTSATDLKLYEIPAVLFPKPETLEQSLACTFSLNSEILHVLSSSGEFPK